MRLPTPVILGDAVVLELPLRTVSGMNVREFWARRKRRVGRERSITRVAMRLAMRLLPEPLERPRLAVHFVRVAPRLLDDDNLPPSCKAIRDEIARWYGVSDAVGGPIRWSYDQVKGKTYAVRIEIRRRDG